MMSECKGPAITGLGVTTFTGHHLNIGFNRRNALEVFKRLLDIPQIQQVSRGDWEGVPKGGSLTRLRRQADGADAPGNDGQFEHSAFDVLRFGKHPRCDVAALDDRVLDALDPEAGGFVAVQQAACFSISQRRGSARVGGGQYGRRKKTGEGLSEAIRAKGRIDLHSNVTGFKSKRHAMIRFRKHIVIPYKSHRIFHVRRP